MGTLRLKYLLYGYMEPLGESVEKLEGRTRGSISLLTDESHFFLRAFRGI